MEHFDSIIIGGGIIGLFSAYEMSLRGHKVLLVDKGEIGSKNPPNSAGVLVPYYPWRYDRAINQLVRLSQKNYIPILKNLVKHTGQDLNYWTSGMVICGVNEAESVDWLGGYDIPFSWLAAADIKPKVGNVQTKFQDALWLESVAQLSPSRLSKALFLFLQQQANVTLKSHSVASIRYGHEKVLGIEIDSDKFSAAAVVVTAGAWSPEVIAENDLPMQVTQSQILSYDLPVGLVKSIFVEGNLQIIPSKEGKVYISSDNTKMGFDVQDRDENKANLQALSESYLPFLKNHKPCDYWEGINSSLQSGVPIITEHPKARCLFLNTGFVKLGVQVAPAAASTMADIIEGKQSDINLRDYRIPSQVPAVVK